MQARDITSRRFPGPKRQCGSGSAQGHRVLALEPKTGDLQRLKTEQIDWPNGGKTINRTSVAQIPAFFQLLVEIFGIAASVTCKSPPAPSRE
jgi:hypothetical protein